LTGNKIRYFSGSVKVRALKNETAKQQLRALLRGQDREGMAGEKHSFPSESKN